MRFRGKRERPAPELNMASMIDATFLLLAFFIMTSAAGTNESRLSPNLRVEQGTDAKDDLEPQVLEVLRVGDEVVYRLGSSDLAGREALSDALGALPADRGLFVRGYPGVDVGSVAAAIQVARDRGFEAVTYVPAK